MSHELTARTEPPTTRNRLGNAALVLGAIGLVTGGLLLAVLVGALANGQ